MSFFLYRLLKFFAISIIVISLVATIKQKRRLMLNYALLGFAYLKLYEFDRSISNSREALKVSLTIKGMKPVTVSVLYGALGLAFTHKGEFQSGILNHKKALMMYKKDNNQLDFNMLAGIYLSLAKAYAGIGEPEKERKSVFKAISILSSNLGVGHPSTLAAIEYMNKI